MTAFAGSAYPQGKRANCNKPNGTASGTAEVLAWKLKVELSEPLELLDVKVHTPGVASKPIPLIVPGPVTLRKLAL